MKTIVAIFLASSVIFFAGCDKDKGTTITILKPSIASITPNQISRAERGVILIRGSNLAPVVSVNLGSGVAIEEMNSISPSEIEIAYSVNTNTAPGVRNVTVTTTTGTATAANLLEVLNNRAPQVKFTVLPDIGTSNTTFLFDGSSTTDTDGQSTEFDWDFGDGKTAHDPIATHRYNAVGTFEARLSVTDDTGATNFASKSIDVREGIAPDPAFSVSPPSGDVTTSFKFDASKSDDDDGSIILFEWTFGDGMSANGMVVQHQFTGSGLFEVTLTVTDNDGFKNQLTKELNVETFDENASAQAIRDVVVEFFNLYERFPSLTADQILVGWSRDSACPGYNHEKKLIESDQMEFRSEDVTILGGIDVTFSSSTRAHSIATANFISVRFDGTIDQGIATHDFSFRLEGTKWLICDFRII